MRASLVCRLEPDHSGVGALLAIMYIPKKSCRPRDVLYYTMCFHTSICCESSPFSPSSPLLGALLAQLASLSEALEANFDYDRYSRSRGHDRHRDEHTDITSLINCVDGKTPSQVRRGAVRQRRSQVEQSRIQQRRQRVREQRFAVARVWCVRGC